MELRLNRTSVKRTETKREILFSPIVETKGVYVFMDAIARIGSQTI